MWINVTHFLMAVAVSIALWGLLAWGLMTFLAWRCPVPGCQ